MPTERSQNRFLGSIILVFGLSMLILVAQYISDSRRPKMSDNLMRRITPARCVHDSSNFAFHFRPMTGLYGGCQLVERMRLRADGQLTWIERVQQRTTCVPYERSPKDHWRDADLTDTLSFTPTLLDGQAIESTLEIRMAATMTRDGVYTSNSYEVYVNGQRYPERLRLTESPGRTPITGR
jgi:hypothetical protein